MDLNRLTIHELRDLLRAGKASPADVVRELTNAKNEHDDTINAYLQFDSNSGNSGDTILNSATELSMVSPDSSLSMVSPDSSLSGIPVAVKDNINTIGTQATCASKILQSYKPLYDATVVRKIKEAGGYVLGKTNLDEFAMGSSTENSAFGPTRNPWDTDRVPGGSSGGSAAAVAADEAICSLGSDTGGSIRQPAAFCGVVGMKPTYGLVSRYGLVAFASSLDQIGPITKDVRDTAILLTAISGHDDMDSTSAPRGATTDYEASLTGDITGLRVGIVTELSGGAGIEEGVQASFRAGIEALESLGATAEEVSLAGFEYALPAYYIIAPAEASSNLARFDGVRYGFRATADDMLDTYKITRSEGFGAEVKRRIMLGTYALSAGYYEAYYGQAQKVRTVIINDFATAFSRFDVLVSPTAPTTAFRIGEKIDDPMQMYLSDICTIPANLAGIPAISLPCGLADGLPVGFQIMGDHFSEELLLRVAHALEKEIGFNRELRA